MARDNKGMSLLELIVVIGIMGILVISAVSLVGMQGGWKVNRAAELIDSAMNRTMVQAMSKGGSPRLLVYRLEGTYYAVIVNDNCQSGPGIWSVTEDKVLDRYELGSGALDLTFSYVGSMGESVPSGTLADQADELQLTSVAEFCFERSTGAIRKVTVNGTECYYTGITVTYESRRKDIVIQSATGKHEIV